MIYDISYEDIQKDLLRFNENKGTMNITEVADYLKMDTDKTSDMLKEYDYIDGKAHRYLVITVARAIKEHLVNKKVTTSDTPLQIIE